MSGGMLVVGAGTAGVQVAASLREYRYTGPVTLAGDEHEAPYHRPPLSKSVLLDHAGGPGAPGPLALRPEGFYQENDIELRLGDPVLGVEFDGPGSSSGRAVTAAGQTLAFDGLALATGAEPRRLGVPGEDLANVLRLRRAGDGARLAAALRASRRLCVVGAGFIGLEVAAAARRLGVDTQVVEVADRALARLCAPPTAEHLVRRHRRSGVRFTFGAAVTEFTGDGAVRGAVLDDGSTIDCDLVVVGVGAVPRTDLARAIGLDCGPGIVVDRRARTSRPGTVAAGDCTLRPAPLTGSRDLGEPGTRVRIESVHNATAQAKAAAASLLGAEVPGGEEVPWFWSDQGDAKLQIAGLSAGHDQYVLRGEPDSGRFSVLYYRDGRLIACDAVNNPRDFTAVRRALARGANLPPSAVHDVSAGLGDLLRVAVERSPS
ncbi:NAD(P)/FAD-dependent oxidoreductase [Streptomyces sp. NPDC052042]|uniref:NAD(P)/FAD-dependent oxidoreductase n=1 Tax=Streptomyces sp. NPDC052042 TaxID=3365683 RepID=UPI0037D4783D